MGLIFKERGHSAEAKQQFEKVIQISKAWGGATDERSFAEAELAKIQTSSLKGKLLSFFK